MRTKVKREYEYKVFGNGQLKQFSLNLTQFCGILPSDLSIYLHYKDGEFETSKDATVDELENICEIDTPLDYLSFHFEKNIIQFSSSLYSKDLSVTYVIYDDIQYTKKFIFFVENALELTLLGEQNVNQLTNQDSQDDPGNSAHEETKDAIDNEQPIGQPQLDQDHTNVLHRVIPTNPLLAVWHKASNQLQLLCSEASYQTWIAPIIPSVEDNQLILNCANEFAKDWIESRYKKDIIETVRSIEPSVEGIIVRVGGKGARQSSEAINKRLFLEIDGPLFELMKQVYERDTEKTIGLTIDQYFTQIIQSHCQERLGHLASE